MAIALEAWLALMRREYFASFIPAGGGAVRVVVGEDATLAATMQTIRAAATEARLTVVTLDTEVIKLHMLQDAVFTIANALDWDAIIQTRLEAMTEACGYRWPTPGQRTTLLLLAQANGVAPGLLNLTLQREITTQVWNDARLSQDFRQAMIALLTARLADDQDATRDAVLDWLRGERRGLKALKGTGIRARITRTNARAVLQSLCHFLHTTGAPGLFVMIDARRLLLERSEALGLVGLIYTPGAVMDCYEVVRQLIDDAEHMQGLFVAVIAGRRLIDGSAPRRAIGAYAALKTRVWNDVRPRGGDNPLAPMVVLSQ